MFRAWSFLERFGSFKIFILYQTAYSFMRTCEHSEIKIASQKEEIVRTLDYTQGLLTQWKILPMVI